DGSLPRLRADDEPDQRRREVHGPGRRSPRSTPRGDAEKGAGDVIDAGRTVDEEVLTQLAGNLLAVDDHVLDVSLGLKSVNALSNSFASSAMPRERSLPVTQGVSALRQAKRWSRSCVLNAGRWSLTLGRGRRPRLCRAVRCAYGRSSALRTGRARPGSGRLQGKRRRSRSPGRRRP